MTPTQRPRTCQARQQSDQMRCARCGLLWDTNDPEPPACPREAVQAPKTMKRRKKP